MFVLIMLCRDWAGWGRYLLVCSNIRVKVSRGGRSRQDAVVGRGATGEKDLLDWVGGLGGHADSGEGWAEEVGGRDDVYRVQRERWWMNRMGVFDEENKRR